MYGGFIHTIDEPNRVELLLQLIETEGRFTEAVSRRDWNPKQSEIFLLSFDGETLAYAALARVRGGSVSGKERLELTDFVPLSNASMELIERSLDKPLARYFSYATTGHGMRVPPATWAGTIDYLKKQSADVAAGLDRLELLRSQQGKRLTGGPFDVISDEKDATALALSMAGFNRRELLSAFDPSVASGGKSLFSGITQSYLLEDKMIEHDKTVFGSWANEANLAVGASVFSRGEDLLLVVNANRTPIEHVTGVDLAYYHHVPDLFVMVQYKRLIQENAEDDEDIGWGYRPDEQCDAEQSRMEKFLSDHPDKWAGDPPTGYRLLPNPFFFKLCKATAFEPYSTELLAGLYIPLENWQRLRATAAKGARGGVRLTYENAQPYLTNTLFVNLVSSRLIGSRGMQSAAIRQLIEDAVNAKRSVIAAEVLPKRE